MLKKERKFGKKDRRQDMKEKEYDQKIIDLARVTRVMAGGKRMRFRACVAIGDRNAKVAIGVAKGADVTMAISKAVAKAKKEMITVPIVNDTIPHEVKIKLGAAKIVIKPAAKGRGVIAGGAVRQVLELSGIPNVSAKIIGTKNKINNVRATIAGLSSLRKVSTKEMNKSKEVEVFFKEQASEKKKPEGNNK